MNEIDWNEKGPWRLVEGEHFPEDCNVREVIDQILAEARVRQDDLLIERKTHYKTGLTVLAISRRWRGQYDWGVLFDGQPQLVPFAEMNHDTKRFRAAARSAARTRQINIAVKQAGDGLIVQAKVERASTG